LNFPIIHIEPYEIIMKTHMFTVTALFLAVGCASDPHKDVRSAQSELNQSQIDATETHGATTTTNREKQAEADREKREKRAEATAETSKETLDARAKVAEAKINMAKEREAFDIDAKERIRKLSARADEAKVKAAKLTGKKASAFKSAWSKYETLKGETVSRLKTLPTVADDTWKNESDNVDKTLNGLEKSIDELNSAM
jgi:hypothetical protein